MAWPRPLLRLSIRTRLALGLALGLCLMALAVIGVSYLLVDRSLSPSGTGGVVVPFAAGGAARTPPDVKYRIISPSGTGGVVVPSAAGGAERTPPDAKYQIISRSGTGGVVVPFAAGGAEPTPADSKYRIIAELRARTMRSLIVTWAAIAGPLVAASGVLGWLLATRMLWPLRSITGAARRLSAESLDQRIALAGPHDELRELADTFDDMLGRLDATFARQRRFAANASHELRTPLAIIRAQIDVALSDPATTRSELLATARVVGQAVDRCQRLLDGLLTLARSDRGLGPAEPADLGQVAGRAVEQVAPDAERERVVVRAALRPAAVRGNRALLERAAGNLVENAVAYNHPQGWVEVVTEGDGDRSVLRVSNSGPVVPSERVADLFEPFVRLWADRTGSGRGAGLGLSVVRMVARAHGGEARARALPAGGLEVTVELPAAQVVEPEPGQEVAALTAT